MLQSGHVSVACSLYFCWNWNSCIHWSLCKEIEVHISMGDLHKLQWPTVMLDLHLSSCFCPPGCQHSLLKGTRKASFGSGSQTLARLLWNDCKWKGQGSLRAESQFCGSLLCSYKITHTKRKCCWAIAWRTLVCFYSLVSEGAVWHWQPFLLSGLRAAEGWWVRIFSPDAAHYQRTWIWSASAILNVTLYSHSAMQLLKL